MQYPFERINLPSNGQCYNNSLSSGKVNLYPLTAKHEDILCSPGLAKDYHHFDIILKDIIQNEDVTNIDELLHVDVEGILLASKMLSFGPKQQSSITCPHCEQTDEYIINLAEYRPIEAVVSESRVFPYKEYNIYFNIPTYGIFKKSNSNIELLKNLIDRIEKQDGTIVEKDYFINKIFLYKDYQKFKKFLQSQFPIITPEINIKCKSCDKIINIPFKFDRNFFGMDGSYKVRLHKEILIILYSSNGGFTHQDIYNMPVNLRILYTKELMDIKKEERDKAKQTEDAPSASSIARAPIPK